MPLTTYRITLLITRSDGAEEIRTVHQEGWSADNAIETAKQRVWASEPEVEDIQCQNVS